MTGDWPEELEPGGALRTDDLTVIRRFTNEGDCFDGLYLVQRGEKPNDLYLDREQGWIDVSEWLKTETGEFDSLATALDHLFVPTLTTPSPPTPEPPG